MNVDVYTERKYSIRFLKKVIFPSLLVFGEKNKAAYQRFSALSCHVLKIGILKTKIGGI